MLFKDPYLTLSDNFVHSVCYLREADASMLGVYRCPRSCVADIAEVLRVCMELMTF